MAAFATVSDLEARWRPLSPDESNRAQALLDDAAAVIRAECADVDSRLVAVPPAILPELDPAVPLMVSCSMVKRAMLSGADVAGVTSTQQTAGPFSQSLSFANPSGDLYLTKAERRILGCGGQRAGSVPMGPSAAVVHPLWCDVWLGLPCTCGAVA